jgi:hypothetical protein
MMDEMEHSLLNAARPEPGADLRARVLAGAMPLVEPNGSRLDCMWFSRKWRTAAMLAVLILAITDAVSGHIVAWGPAAQNRAAADTVRTVEMAAREAGLSPADTGALVAQAIAATSPPRITLLNMDTSDQRSNR